MSIFQRLSKIFEAKANNLVDQAEDPAIMEAQAVRDLKAKLQTAVEAEIQLKTIIVEKRKKASEKQAEADTWTSKANQLLDQAGNGLTQEEAERLATEALTQQTEAKTIADHFNADADAQQKSLDALEGKVSSFRKDIETLEQKLADVKARESSAKATLDINEKVSHLDGQNDAQELINRMEDKVTHLESQATAVEQLGENTKTDAEKINEILAKTTKPSGASALEALKAKRAEKTV